MNTDYQDFKKRKDKIVRLKKIGKVPSLFKIVPLDFQSLSENLLKYQICFNPFHKIRNQGWAGRKRYRTVS